MVISIKKSVTKGALPALILGKNYIKADYIADNLAAGCAESDLLLLEEFHKRKINFEKNPEVDGGSLLEDGEVWGIWQDTPKGLFILLPDSNIRHNMVVDGLSEVILFSLDINSEKGLLCKDHPIISYLPNLKFFALTRLPLDVVNRLSTMLSQILVKDRCQIISLTYLLKYLDNLVAKQDPNDLYLNLLTRFTNNSIDGSNPGIPNCLTTWEVLVNLQVNVVSIASVCRFRSQKPVKKCLGLIK